jgi:glycosyltransferase-like protein
MTLDNPPRAPGANSAAGAARDGSAPRVAAGLRVGLFTHSTNPRGGVVHCLELAEALAARGHAVTVHAPAQPGGGFFRTATLARQALVPAGPAPAGGLAALVRQRVAEYQRYFESGAAGASDVYHAHDGLSGVALAGLVDRGVIPGFVRTVHHLDVFADEYLRDAQDLSIRAAARCACVSRLWRDALRDRYGVEATVVSNGVDTARFNPRPCANDGLLRDRLMDGGGRAPMFLAVGGVERRKNTLNALRAFLLVRRELPRALLLIAGGASLLDHSEYRREYEALLGEAARAEGDGEAGGGAAVADLAKAVVVTGPLPDDQMAAAYRLADALVFPSVTEGFGLAVLEAMACGTPAVVSRVAPFTEYLTDADALLVDPHDPAAIAAAMRQAADGPTRARLRAAGLAVAARFPWSAAAAAHEEMYREVVAAQSAAGGRAGAATPSDVTSEAAGDPAAAVPNGVPSDARDAVHGAVAG